MEIGSNIEMNLKEITSCKVNYFDRIFKTLNCYYFSSGRGAINAIIGNFSKSTRYFLPNFLCEDVFNCFKEKNITFYNVSDNFFYQINNLNLAKQNNVFFVSNYFGLSDERALIKEIAALKRKYNIKIIYDITHSIFCSNLSDEVDFYVGSIRKWLPLPDSAIVASKFNLSVPKVKYEESFVEKYVYASLLKSLYLSKKEKDDNIKKIFKQLYFKCEEYIGNLKAPTLISDFSTIFIQKYDYNKMKIRVKNFNFLRRKLSNKLVEPIFSHCKNKIPFVFPVYCEHRDSLRKVLEKNSIYCPVHWHQNFDINFNKNIGEKILSLPIDERYGKKEINKIAKVVNSFGVKNV